MNVNKFTYVHIYRTYVHSYKANSFTVPMYIRIMLYSYIQYAYILCICVTNVAIMACTVPGMLYQVDVVAFNSRGRGATSKPRSFYSQELLPTQSIQNVIFDRSGEYVGISWDALALSEARGFPVYTVTLTPSTSNEKQIITGVISMNTTESSIVVGDLDANTEYMLTVGVGTTAGQVTSDRGNHYIYLITINICD